MIAVPGGLCKLADRWMGWAQKGILLWEINERTQVGYASSDAFKGNLKQGDVVVLVELIGTPTVEVLTGRKQYPLAKLLHPDHGPVWCRTVCLEGVATTEASENP